MTTTTPLPDAELAYLGGFFDGEGFAGLYWSKSDRYWKAQIGIAQDSSPTVRYWFERWAKVFGGRVVYKTRSSELVLAFQSRSAITEFLKQVTPYTKIKRRQLVVLENYLVSKQYSYRTSQILKALKRMEE